MNPTPGIAALPEPKMRMATWPVEGDNPNDDGLSWKHGYGETIWGNNPGELLRYQEQIAA